MPAELRQYYGGVQRKDAPLESSVHQEGDLQSLPSTRDASVSQQLSIQNPGLIVRNGVAPPLLPTVSSGAELHQLEVPTKLDVAQAKPLPKRRVGSGRSGTMSSATSPDSSLQKNTAHDPEKRESQKKMISEANLESQTKSLSPTSQAHVEESGAKPPPRRRGASGRKNMAPGVAINTSEIGPAPVK